MNDHERDPLVRLRAIDPAAGATYEHADISAMFDRVTARPRLERVSFARGFRVRITGAVAAAALVSLGGIAIMETAVPSLSVLAIGASSNGGRSSFATSLPNTQIQTPSATSGPQISSDVTFVAGPGLSSVGENAPSYVLTPAGSFSALSVRIARVLGAAGTSSARAGADSYWTIGATCGKSVSFWSDEAELNWEFTNSDSFGGPCARPGADATGPTGGVGDADALARSLSLLDHLGVTGPFGTATYQRAPNGEGSTWTTVSIPWVVGGPGSGFEFDVTLSGVGDVVAADGVDVTVTRSVAYPLISPVAGVAELNGVERTPSTTGTTTAPTIPPGVNPGGPMIPASTTATINPGGPMIPVSPAADPTIAPPATSSGSSGSDPAIANDTISTTRSVVTLETATLQYGEYGLTNGTEILLPQWLYTGKDGSQWMVLAVAPAYVHVDTSAGAGFATPEGS